MNIITSIDLTKYRYPFGTPILLGINNPIYWSQLVYYYLVN